MRVCQSSEQYLLDVQHGVVLGCDEGGGVMEVELRGAKENESVRSRRASFVYVCLFFFLFFEPW